jgi:hypothetical protein
MHSYPHFDMYVYMPILKEYSFYFRDGLNEVLHCSVVATNHLYLPLPRLNIDIIYMGSRDHVCHTENVDKGTIYYCVLVNDVDGTNQVRECILYNHNQWFSHLHAHARLVHDVCTNATQCAY